MLSHRGRNGFTLIELLVVIAVIAILAAILFPVFAQAREKARQAACLSNLKQIGAAMLMYTDDYDGVYPWNRGPRFTPSRIADTLLREDRGDLSNRWDGAPLVLLLSSFVKNDRMWYCPAMPDATPENGVGTSYQVNAFIAVNTIPEPERPHGGPVSPSDLVAPTRLRVFQDFWNQGHGVHRDGVNSVCADGHATWQRAGLGGPTVARWWTP